MRLRGSGSDSYSADVGMCCCVSAWYTPLKGIITSLLISLFLLLSLLFVFHQNSASEDFHYSSSLCHWLKTERMCIHEVLLTNWLNRAQNHAAMLEVCIIWTNLRRSYIDSSEIYYAAVIARLCISSDVYKSTRNSFASTGPTFIYDVTLLHHSLSQTWRW